MCIRDRGTTIGYVDNTGGSCRFMEMQQVQREQEPIVVETSKVVQNWMPNTIDHVINSPENGIVLLRDQKNLDAYHYGFKYQDYGERKQAAWFRWSFDAGQSGSTAGGIRYSFIVDDALYLLSTDNFLMRLSIVQSTAPNDPRHGSISNLSTSIQNLNFKPPIYLDNWVTMVGGQYNSTTNKTTFTHGTASADFDWHANIGGYNPGEASEELFLQYTTHSSPTSSEANWIDAGKIIPINNAKPAGLNTYSVTLSTAIKEAGNVSFRLYQPYNTSYVTGGGSVAAMDTYGIVDLVYKTASGTHSILDMSQNSNLVHTSAAVGKASDTISNYHTGNGTGNSGGFNHDGDYLWFSGQQDQTAGDGRHVIVPPINVTTNSITEVEISAYVGNDSNGGEWPDIEGTSSLSTDGYNDDGLFAVGFRTNNSIGYTGKTYELAQPVEDLILGQSFKVTGDWSNATIYVGFNVTASLDFPIFYYTQQQGETIKRDHEDYLVLHRLKLNTQEVSSFSAYISTNQPGYKGWGLIYHTTSTNNPGSYYTGSIEQAAVGNFCIPVYRKNKDAKLTIIQNSSTNEYGPLNLQSVTFEGDYNPKNYRRV